MIYLMRIVKTLVLLTLSFTLTCASNRNDIFVGYSEAGCKDELESEICESYKASGMCTTGDCLNLRDTFLSWSVPGQY